MWPEPSGWQKKKVRVAYYLGSVLEGILWRPDPAGTETSLRRIYAGQKYPHVYTLSISTCKNQSAEAQW